MPKRKGTGSTAPPGSRKNTGKNDSSGDGNGKYSSLAEVNRANKKIARRRERLEQRGQSTEAVCIIYVKTLIGKTLTLNVNPTDMILTIKRMIQDEVDLRIEDQRLLFWKHVVSYENDVREYLENRTNPVGMKVLEENNSIDHYGIDNNSMILLTLNLRGEDGGEDDRDNDKDELLKTQFKSFEQQVPELGEGVRSEMLNITSVWKRDGNRVATSSQSTVVGEGTARPIDEELPKPTHKRSVDEMNHNDPHNKRVCVHNDASSKDTPTPKLVSRKFVTLLFTSSLDHLTPHSNSITARCDLFAVVGLAS